MRASSRSEEKDRKSLTYCESAIANSAIFQINVFFLLVNSNNLIIIMIRFDFFD